jgi:hypothetical protein
MPPIVDIKTGTITGCKTEKEMFHEQGHLEFQKTDKGATMQWASEMALIFMLGSLSLAFFISIFKYFSVVLFLFQIFCIIYEEMWVNEYAEKSEKSQKDLNSVNN